MSSRLGRVVAYALVLVLAVELAVWECFLVPLRLLGVPLPLAAVAAVVGNLLLGRAGVRVAGAPAGGVGPGACWVLVALGLSLSGPLGDAIVPGNVRGMVFLVAGMVAAVAAVGGGNRRASGATPAGFSGR